MAQVMKKRRLVNAGRRRMTAKQIKFFGTARQRAALKNSRRRRNLGPRHKGRRRNQGAGVVSQVEHAAERAIEKIEDLAESALGGVTHLGNRGRRRNVGEILTVLPANPGRRRRRMAATRTKNRRRSNRGRVRASNRSRRRNRNQGRARHRNRTRRRMSNPKVVVRYRNRARRHNFRYRRRNPNFLAGDAGKVVGVLGGAAVTGIISNYLPSNLTQGWMGYLTTSVVAVVLGQVAGKAMRNSAVGTYVTVGGLLIVGLKILQQFMPQLQLPFTLASTSAGTGLITGSNFYVPQVNVPGSMATFVTPAGITGAIPVAAPVAATGMHGLGAQPLVGLRSIRRVGRFR